VSKQVIIIGCGFAGAAAAVACAERGYETTVLESRRHPGGRAFSFADDDTGDILDNGQHLFMGCYAATLKLLRSLGTEHNLTAQKSFRVEFLRKGGSQTTLSSMPIHIGSFSVDLALGIVFSNHFSLREKYSFLGAILSLRSMQPQSVQTLTIDELLLKLRQLDSLRENFWNPFIIAVMNNEPHNACAALLVEVFHRAFFASADDACLMFARAGLSDLLSPLGNFLASKKSTSRFGSHVENIVIENAKAKGVQLSSGEFIGADAVISAIPAYQLSRLLPKETLSVPPFLSLKEFIPSPIVSAYFWFDRKVMRDDFACAIGTTIQWVFNRTKIIQMPGDGQLLSVVISASDTIAAHSVKEIMERCLDDLHSILPDSRNAILLQWKVVKEKQATFVCFPRVETLRPAAATPIHNFFLAGDWTNTGLPATIEGACQSGYEAAKRAAEFLL
jgi:squalene-associated FAD-dependent desaturase